MKVGDRVKLVMSQVDINNLALNIGHGIPCESGDVGTITGELALMTRLIEVTFDHGPSVFWTEAELEVLPCV